MSENYSQVEQVKIARKISAGLRPSLLWQKLQPFHDKEMAESDPDCKCFENDLYDVTLRMFETGWALSPDKKGKWAVIGISAKDGTPRHDWREFQKIKNDLVGTNWEAIELYPDEQRLLDPSNYYMLWCAPKIPIGKYNGREIHNEQTCIAPQRPFAK